MREALVWQALERALPDYIKATRFEVMQPPGTSDVFWTDQRTSISGWIELKSCGAEDKELVHGKIPKLRPDQPMFMRRQAENGVPCGILMRVGKDHWYFWRARPDRGWVGQIRSGYAMNMADVYHRGTRPPIEHIFVALGIRSEVV